MKRKAQNPSARWARAAAAVAFAVVLAGSGCRGDETPATPRSGTTAGGAYTVSYQPTPDPIPLNQHFDLDVIVTTATGAEPTTDTTLHVDGWMPDHGHGMNVAPEISNTAPGRYRVEGMLFHMPGTWQLRFDVLAAGTAARAEFPVELDAN